MKKNNLSRRYFIEMGLIATGSVLLLPRCANLSNISEWGFFTEKEALLVNAIIEQIIPTDDWLGARDAGVANFIDKQLVGPYARYQEKYRSGLVAVELSCMELYQRHFEELSVQGQTGFLKKMEAGKLTFKQKKVNSNGQDNKIWDGVSDRELFNLIRNHTMQGFYGSPRHGGNRNYESYRMIGLDYPLIIGQNRDEK